ncbi:tail fiber protein [uncultured Paracoccus sp.]|uniref:tail fiber protein n=1 Tax=uncultured Paracoccus sp. TaxID=189685 RepID=UPI0025CF91C7|nr:tail fiber protein [uncultured Paracoccus sp.]
MANLPEADEWPAGIYQLETTDPVIGGPPNEATKAGVDNIPHQQLAKRTNWLHVRVNQLLGLVVVATTSVAGIVRLSNATNSTSTTMAATPAAVKAAMDNADGRVPAARQVNAAGLAAGGGSLNANVTITVPDATQAEAAAGVITNKAMSPLRVAQAIAAAVDLVRKAGTDYISGNKHFSGLLRSYNTENGYFLDLNSVASSPLALKKGTDSSFETTHAIYSDDVVNPLTPSTPASLLTRQMGDGRYVTQSGQQIVAGRKRFSDPVTIGLTDSANPTAANETGVLISAAFGTVNVQSDGSAPTFYAGRPSDGQVHLFRRSGAGVGAISVTATSTSYSTSSDYRLKQAQDAPADYDAVEMVQQLDAAMRWFTFKTDPASLQLGWFAHELAEVEPRAVSGEKDAVDADGNILTQGRDDSKLIPHLVAALGQALRRIEALENGNV